MFVLSQWVCEPRVTQYLCRSCCSSLLLKYHKPNTSHHTDQMKNLSISFTKFQFSGCSTTYLKIFEHHTRTYFSSNLSVNGRNSGSDHETVSLFVDSVVVRCWPVSVVEWVPHVRFRSEQVDSSFWSGLPYPLTWRSEVMSVPLLYQRNTWTIAHYWS